MKEREQGDWQNPAEAISGVVGVTSLISMRALVWAPFGLLVAVLVLGALRWWH